MLNQNLINKYLSKPIDGLNEYLTRISFLHPNHRFLRGATQADYIRLTNLLKHIVISKGETPNQIDILDWGAGKGHISYLLKLAGFNVTSCDLLDAKGGDNAFRHATPIINDHHIPVVPLTNDWELPFANASFDAVVSFGVLEHVADDYRSLCEIHRILKPNGIFFFCFLPYTLSWTQRLAHLRGNYYHNRLYSIKKIKKLALESGFEPLAVWHGQLLPKNSLPHNNYIEKLDRFLTAQTPLRYLATNLEGIFISR